MKIKNTYHKRLSFEFDDLGPFSIDTNEEKNVEEKLGKRLIMNSWIKEIKKIEEKVSKGRINT